MPERPPKVSRDPQRSGTVSGPTRAWPMKSPGCGRFSTVCPRFVPSASQRCAGSSPKVRPQCPVRPSPKDFSRKRSWRRSSEIGFHVPGVGCQVHPGAASQKTDATERVPPRSKDGRDEARPSRRGDRQPARVPFPWRTTLCRGPSCLLWRGTLCRAHEGNRDGGVRGRPGETRRRTRRSASLQSQKMDATKRVPPGGAGAYLYP